eukprot:3535726-Prymnesium_polylepis.1
MQSINRVAVGVGPQSQEPRHWKPSTRVASLSVTLMNSPVRDTKPTPYCYKKRRRVGSGYEVTVVGAVAERPNRWWAGRGRVPHR